MPRAVWKWTLGRPDGSGAAGGVSARRALAWRARLCAGLGVVGCLLGAMALSAGPALADTASFTTQGCSTWSVPSAVSSVQIAAVGAAGADGTGTSGAFGDGLSATLSVAAGETLDVCVDFGGGDGVLGSGAGGGASGVGVGSDFSAPVVVAGGGGGGSAPNSGAGANGGAPGLPAGANGGSPPAISAPVSVVVAVITRRCQAAAPGRTAGPATHRTRAARALEASVGPAGVVAVVAGLATTVAVAEPEALRVVGVAVVAARIFARALPR